MLKMILLFVCVCSLNHLFFQYPLDGKFKTIIVGKWRLIYNLPKMLLLLVKIRISTSQFTQRALGWEKMHKQVFFGVCVFVSTYTQIVVLFQSSAISPIAN